MGVRVYLAGPEVFLPNAREIGARKRAICERHGLVGAFPGDEEDALDPALSLADRALAISRAMEHVMRGCDAMIVNLTPFRGPRHEDPDGMAIEPFGLHDNLMLVGGIVASGGCLIAETTAVTERYTSLVGHRHQRSPVDGQELLAVGHAVLRVRRAARPDAALPRV